MNIIAAVNVNLDESPMGLSSRLREPLENRPVLRRTIERALRVEGASGVHVLTPPSQVEEVRAILDGLDVRIETHNAPAPPYQALVRAGRFWGLDGWRGGVGSLCVFDEDFNAPLLQGLVAKTRADAVMSIPGAAPLLDADLLSSMIAHFRANIDMARMTIMQAPPGLNAIIVARDIIEQLVGVGMPPGAMLVYQPDAPAPDLTGREACYRPDAAIVRASGRLLCDTSRSVERVRRIMAAGGDTWNAATICRWLSDVDQQHLVNTPDDIEIELTTEDQFGAGDLFNPRGDAVPTRGPIRLTAIERIAESIAGVDDVRIVLAGFGEPTLHPEFPGICRALREAGAGAICVRTNGVALTGAAEAALFDTPVDVVEVMIDAVSAETYQRVHGLNAYDKVIANLNRWAALRMERASVRPLLVPSFVKSHDTLAELEPFVDTWQRQLGAYAVRGASHYAGQRPDRAVTSMSPPRRDACRRLFSRIVVLADGTVTTCDQDYSARQAIGSILDHSLESLWRGEALTAVRANDPGRCALCPKCDEWHRP
ncbi:MAG TPA: SPASM domain-containing protein [Phycisphaerae bacterium]|nr:SPASM domain-containing protein [Phycisphaerae bacterium]HRW52711.1 SPASM domain-containing protein [Phycisphaerae bacterium]